MTAYCNKLEPRSAPTLKVMYIRPQMKR